MDVQFGSVEAVNQAASYTDASGAYMDYDAGGGYAQFGAKAAASGSIGAKIRTILAGVVKDAITIAASGLTITLLAGSTLAAQAVTATTIGATGTITLTQANAGTQHLIIDNSATASGRKWHLGYSGLGSGSVAQFAIYVEPDNVTALTLNAAGALTIASTLTVSAGGLAVNSGNTAVQSFNATAIGIGAGASANASLYNGATQNAGVTQYGFLNQPTFGSSVTSQGITQYTQLSTVASAFTLATGYGHYIANPSKGAGSTITTVYGIYIENMTAGGTNYAIQTNGGRVGFKSLPTSAAGLASGDLWNNSGVINVV